MGLLPNLLNDNSRKKAAGSVSDMERSLANDDWITIHPYGFLQGEGEDETKQYYRRIYIDDEGNIEKGIGKGHNFKEFFKKKEKEGTEGKTPGTKEDTSGLTELQKKVKVLIDDGKPYDEAKAQKVGEVLLQELEKSQDFKDVIAITKVIKKARQEVNKFFPRRDDEKCKKAYEDFVKYSNDMRMKWVRREIKHYDPYNDPVYQKLEKDVSKTEREAEERNKKEVLEKYGLGHLVTDDELSEKTIEIVHKSLDGVIDFNKNNNPKDFTKSKDLQNTVKNALSVFPKNLIDELKEQGIHAKKSTARRSCYDPLLKQVNISGGQNDVGTVAHEFSHAVEHSNPDILKIEEEFYNRRTKGEPLQKLSTVTGNSNFKKYEVTRTDSFLNSYMGKDYTNPKTGKPDAYELLSMGTEYLVTKPDKLMEDRDYARFVLGCLAYRRK